MDFTKKIRNEKLRYQCKSNYSNSQIIIYNKK